MSTRILWNGHQHQFDREQNGAPEDGVEYILWRMKDHALDPTFEDYGSFLYRPEPLPGRPEWPPGVMRFSGNFHTYSHSFCIETDEPDLIERLRAAVAENMARPSYAKAKADIARCEALRREAQERRAREHRERREAEARSILGVKA